MRVGIGYDSHRFASGRKLILGGAEIPFEKGLLGHSDADVLCHAITDALLGALGLGDIGQHFPDSDEKWKDASSIDLLSQVVTMAGEKGFTVGWIDSIVIMEQPKLAGHIDAMKKNIAGAGIGADCISIKAKTNEGMGYVGRGEGVVAQAACVLTATK